MCLPAMDRWDQRTALEIKPGHSRFLHLLLQSNSPFPELLLHAHDYAHHGQPYSPDGPDIKGTCRT